MRGPRTILLRCTGPPPMCSRKLFWRDEHAAFVGYGSTRADEALDAMKVEWEGHVAQCSRRARLEMMMARATPATRPWAAGLVLPPAAGLKLPADALCLVISFVAPAHYGTPFYTPTPALWGVIPGAQAAGPRLAHVACTLASEVTGDIEQLSRTVDVQHMAGIALQPIRDLQQMVAGEDCKWLYGYCDFLMGRYGRGGESVE